MASASSWTPPSRGRRATCCGGARQSTSQRLWSTLTTCSPACPRHRRREPQSRPLQSPVQARQLPSPRRLSRPSPSRRSRQNSSFAGHLWCPESSSRPRENAAFFLCVGIVGGSVCGVHTSKQFRAGGHYVCRKHAGNFLGPTYSQELDHAHVVRTAGAGNQSLAAVAVAEDCRPALSPGPSHAGVIGGAATGRAARPSPETHLDRSKESRRQRARR